MPLRTVSSAQFPQQASPHVHNFLSQHRLGLIRHENICSLKLSAEFATAFPTNSMAIITKNNNFARKIISHLENNGLHAQYARISGETAPPWQTRIVVGSPLGMAHNSVEFEKREIVLFPDAFSAFHERSKLALSSPDMRANLFGIISEKKLQNATLLQRKQLLATFGSRSTYVTGYGEKKIDVEFCYLPFNGEYPRCNDRELKWHGIVGNSARNKYIAETAKHLCNRGRRVLVLTESIEHLQQLTPYLTGWPLLLQSPTRPSEFPADVRAKLNPNYLFNSGDRTLSTVDSIFRAELNVDAIVWASSSSKLPRLPRKLLVDESNSQRGLLFVDVVDRHHKTLNHWSRLRIRECRNRGWHESQMEVA